MVDANRFRAWMMDPEADEREVQAVLGAARMYLTGAGVPALMDNEEKDMVILQLAGYWWESRGPGQSGEYPAPPPSVRSMILHLRYADEEGQA
jgi:hypothetical protein